MLLSFLRLKIRPEVSMFGTAQYYVGRVRSRYEIGSRGGTEKLRF
jgi:hypothetical protein